MTVHKPKTNLRLVPLLVAAAKSLPTSLTLCSPIDGSPQAPFPGVLQARTLEWVVISFSAWKWKVKVKSLSHVWLFTTPWTATYQAPPSMGCSRQEYWSGLPLPLLHPLFSKYQNFKPLEGKQMFTISDIVCTVCAERVHLFFLTHCLILFK